MGLSALLHSGAVAAEKTAGKTYYVDPAAGNDANDGLSPERPLKTDSTRQFAAGDTILLKRGCVIRNALVARCGTPLAPITYGAYGDGPKPAFMGSVPLGDPNRWVQQRPSIWRYTGEIPSEVCNLVFNGGASCGILRWSADDVRQPGDWHSTGIGANASSDPAKHLAGAVLYLCSPTNPGRAYADIECVLWGRRRLASGQHDLVLQDLCFCNSGVHGYQDSQVKNVVIRNCEFRHIGGAVWSLPYRIRFGNAVELWDGAGDVTVEGCVLDNIYDTGVTHQGGETRNIPERIFFRNNLFLDCGLAAYECREPSREVYFEYNTCIRAGGGFSMQGQVPPRRTDPYPQPVGYHVFVWMIDAGTQPGNVYIRHNLFCESYGAAFSAVVAPADERKFILDENCYWQTTGPKLIQITRLAKGKTWAEAMQEFTGAGKLPLDENVRSYGATEFSRYQAESRQDQHSRVSKPLSVDEAAGDYRQRDASPCRDMGVQIDLGRRVRTPTTKEPGKP